ncbi:MAG: potassium channel family protein [Xanthobacteraceae bacterium]|nr:potassium channel family protein [Xanthobacteraceae bacterium]
MLAQILAGTAVSVLNIVIHATVMTAVVHAVHTVSARRTPHPQVRLTAVMIATVTILMAAHACEVFVWATAYLILDATPVRANFMYFAFVNYTTLGYGDITPTQQWLLLGPITAMNGVLLFGWSTAVIFEILRKTMAGGVAPAAR